MWRRHSCLPCQHSCRHIFFRCATFVMGLQSYLSLQETIAFTLENNLSRAKGGAPGNSSPKKGSAQESDNLPKWPAFPEEGSLAA